jgi:hypothetical protein
MDIVKIILFAICGIIILGGIPFLFSLIGGINNTRYQIGNNKPIEPNRWSNNKEGNLFFVILWVVAIIVEFLLWKFG